MMSTKGSATNVVFWFHILITFVAWFGFFLVDWRIMIPIYIIVQLQFSFLGKCVLNKHHDLEEEDHYTLYSYMFEKVGFKVNHKAMHFFVRKLSNLLYITLTIIWQIMLGMKPLLVLPF